MPYTLQQLSDRQDIADLLAQYCRAIDDNRPSDVVELFVEECVLDYGEQYPPVEGRDFAFKFFRGGTDRLYKRSSHNISNIEVTFTGDDTATAITYLSAWHEFHAHQPDAWIFGRYYDDLVRTDDGWRIEKRIFRALGDHNWVGDISYADRC